MENKQREIRISPSEKAYIRSGVWADKNWRTINMEEGLDTNNNEVFILTAGDPNGDHCRRALFTFDLTPIKGMDYKRVVINPSYIKVNDRHEVCGYLHRTSSDWCGETVTWNTAPEMGEKICNETPIGCLSVLDVTEEVTRLLAAGEDKLSVIMRITNFKGRHTELNPKNAVLIATEDGAVSSFTRQLCDDPVKNQAIWNRAEMLFQEWNERYQKLLKTGLAKVKKIESDPKHYDKIANTAGSGFAPKGGWPAEMAFQQQIPSRTYGAIDDL